MWICLNNAFLSIVSKGGDKSKLCVRARRREHITNVFPDAQVIESTNTDYAFRAFIKRDEVARVIAGRLENIDYDNFKNSTAKVDHDLAHAYGQVWGAMYNLQRRTPLSNK